MANRQRDENQQNVNSDAALAQIERYDWQMRNWQGDQAGQPVALGSPAHLQLFCRMLLDTHNPYKPAVIHWPELDAPALQRVTSLPIWDIAVQTEGRAAVRVKTFAETVNEPQLREALLMDAGEEARHKIVLSRLVQAYDIALQPEPDYHPPADPEWAWMVTGYSECIDSFFAFGLFDLARDSGFFPAELVETFEPVMQEEARHILFFVNWVAWHRQQLSWWRRLKFDLRTAAVWLFLIWERIGIARGLDAQGDMQDANFAVSGAEQLGIDVQPLELIQRCLRENELRMRGYDSRLLRPEAVPRLARFASRWMSRGK